MDEDERGFEAWLYLRSGNTVKLGWMTVAQFVALDTAHRNQNTARVSIYYKSYRNSNRTQLFSVFGHDIMAMSSSEVD